MEEMENLKCGLFSKNHSQHRAGSCQRCFIQAYSDREVKRGRTTAGESFSLNLLFNLDLGKTLHAGLLYLAHI